MPGSEPLSPLFGQFSRYTSQFALRPWRALQMDLGLDRYTWRARIAPVYLAAVPAILAIAATLPDGLNLPLAGASAVVFVPLSYFAGQVAADFGKRLEPGLWDSWGGPPTSRFLRHDNCELNAATRERIHARLRTLGLEIPSQEMERADPSAALTLYGSAVDELRRLTRDTTQFPLVFKGNVEYAFRRNLLGLRKIALTVALAGIAASAWAGIHEWNTAGTVAPVPTVALLLITSLFLAWLYGVRPNTVRVTADRYAHYLLEAALDVEAS